MDERYMAVMAKSYANQQGGLTIPAADLVRPVTLPLGFQPLGIASAAGSDGTTSLAIAAYFEPAVCLVNARRDEAGLHLAVSWVRGANHGIESVRLFPGIYQPGGANRAQCALFGPGGTLWVSRNGERKFFILSPPEQPGGRWRVTGKAPKLANLPAGGEHMLHSAKLTADGEQLYAVESSLDGDRWYYCHYELHQGVFEHAEPPCNIAPFLYGIERVGDQSNFVTDFRCELPAAIYALAGTTEPKLVCPDIHGNGLAALDDGTFLVSTYGQGHPGPFNGVPGSLTIVTPGAMQPPPA